MPSLSRTHSLRRTAWLLAAVAVAGAVVGVAAPAQADPFAVAVADGHPDFGPVKQGTVVTQRFDLLNTGDDDEYIDPTNLGLLTTPFTAGSITFSSTDRIPHLGIASFTVSYTAPAAGTNSRQDIAISVTDADHTATPISLVLSFKGQSLATDPAHFTISTSGGGSAVDFGSVTIGQSSTQTVTLFNDGVLPLRFKNSEITIKDTSGVTLPNVTLSNSSFGDAGADYAPGDSATFDLTFAPTTDGTTSGVVRIVGTQATNDPEPPSVIAETDLTGVATAVIPPTTPPTTPPTATPTPSATPTPIVVGTTGTTGTTTGGGSTVLASTGLATQSPVLIGAAATSLGVAAVLLAVAYRRFARRERKQ